MKVKKKLFETCLMPAIIYGLEVWRRSAATETKEISKIQVSALKQILRLSKSAPNIGILYETGIWPIKERIEYSRMMLFHSIMNSNDERISKKIIEQQQKEKLKNTMQERVKDISKELEINIAKVGAIKKSTWKRLVKSKMKNKIEKRLKKEMEGKIESRTIKEDKWRMKEYILNCNGKVAMDIMLVRLHM